MATNNSSLFIGMSIDFAISEAMLKQKWYAETPKHVARLLQDSKTYSLPSLRISFNESHLKHYQPDSKDVSLVDIPAIDVARSPSL